MANLQREDGTSGLNGDDALRPHSLESCSLEQAFVSSAPTPARLAEILECWLRFGDHGWIRPQDSYFIESLYGHGDEFVWEILDLLDLQFPLAFANADEGVREPDQRLVSLMQSQWPTSFGYLERNSDGTLSGFCWENTYPELLQAAFYPLAPQHQSRTRVIFRGPVETGLASLPGTGLVQPTLAPETRRAPNLEPAGHGRIWYDSRATYICTYSDIYANYLTYAQWTGSWPSL
jgi:hypothetical protein